MTFTEIRWPATGAGGHGSWGRQTRSSPSWLSPRQCPRAARTLARRSCAPSRLHTARSAASTPTSRQRRKQLRRQPLVLVDNIVRHVLVPLSMVCSKSVSVHLCFRKCWPQLSVFGCSVNAHREMSEISLKYFRPQKFHKILQLYSCTRSVISSSSPPLNHRRRSTFLGTFFNNSHQLLHNPWLSPPCPPPQKKFLCVHDCMLTATGVINN